MIDTDTFFSLWFWLFAALFWSVATYFTHGVPPGVLGRALRHDGEDADLAEHLARRSVARSAAAVRRWGVAGAALGGFALAGLGTAAFAAGFELAQGLFALAAPAAAMAAGALREAVRLDAAAPPREALLAHLLRRRWANQFFAILGAGLAAAMMLGLHGDRLALFRGL